MACIEIGKEGLTPDVARNWILREMEYRGAPSNYAEAGTLVHYALRDLCPEVPTNTGI